jgi:hypothetical protein
MMAYFVQNHEADVYLLICLRKMELKGVKGGLATAKIVFKFLQANIADEDTDFFMKKIEEVLKKFAGNAYHFRFDIEPSFPAIAPKNQKMKSNGASGQPKT